MARTDEDIRKAPVNGEGEGGFEETGGGLDGNAGAYDDACPDEDDLGEDEYEDEDTEEEEEEEEEYDPGDGTKPKSRLIAIILALFLGTFGIDFFYLNQPVPGAILLIVGGIAIMRAGSWLAVLILIALFFAQIGRVFFYTLMKKENWVRAYRTKKAPEFEQYVD